MLKKIFLIFAFTICSVSFAQTISHSLLHGNMVVRSQRVVILGTTINGSMTVYSAKKQPLVALQCKSNISGDIIFKGAAGIVRKSIDSILKGKIINGKMVPDTSNVKCH